MGAEETYGRGILRRPAELARGILEVSVQILVRVLHRPRAIVGVLVRLGAGVRDPLDVRFLRVRLVKEHAVADAWLLGQDGPRAHAGVLDVEGRHDLGGADVGVAGLTAGDVEDEEAVFDVHVFLFECVGQRLAADVFGGDAKVSRKRARSVEGPCSAGGELGLDGVGGGVLDQGAIGGLRGLSLGWRSSCSDARAAADRIGIHGGALDW